MTDPREAMRKEAEQTAAEVFRLVDCYEERGDVYSKIRADVISALVTFALAQRQAPATRGAVLVDVAVRPEMLGETKHHLEQVRKAILKEAGVHERDATKRFSGVATDCQIAKESQDGNHTMRTLAWGLLFGALLIGWAIVA